MAETKAHGLLVDEMGADTIESVDSMVVDYIVNVLVDSFAAEVEIETVLIPFICALGLPPGKENSQSNSAADSARTVIRAIRVGCFGQEFVDGRKEEEEAREALVMLAAPKRMGAGIKMAGGIDDGKGPRPTRGGTRVGGGGNSNAALDRSREAAEAKNMTQMRKARRAGKEVKQSLLEQLPAVSTTSKFKVQAGTRDVRIEGVDLAFGGIQLLESATINLAYGRRYGVIGRNGCGKTTLMKAIARRELPLAEDMDILYVEQEVVADETTPLQIVLDSDFERAALIADEKVIQAKIKQELPLEEDETVEDIETRLSDIYLRMEEMGADQAVSRAGAILSGLGFDSAMQKQPSSSFSGGWRMRIAIARALFCEPMLLLLDEPTNHLDLHTVLWLADYLQQWPHTVVVVSHDRDFLNEVCTDVLHVKDKLLHPYSGNYDDFEKARADKLKELMRSAESQEMRRAHVQKFVDRFRYNAKRASMAQSRIKVLEKMEEQRVLLPSEEEEFRFSFPDPGVLTGSHSSIILSDVTFTYPGTSQPIFENLDFSINCDSRVSLVGPNGAGKSTLLKLLLGLNEPTKGDMRKSSKLRLGYFSQHHMDQLVLWRTPLEHMSALFPDATLPELRSHLSNVGVKTDMQIRPILTLSGGQKSRVAFSVITYSKPHILLCDEPSNHLDLETIDALVEALNQFKGGIVLVSHDSRLIATVCDELLVCKDGKVNPYRGEFREYRAELVKTLVKPQFKQKNG